MRLVYSAVFVEYIINEINRKWRTNLHRKTTNVRKNSILTVCLYQKVENWCTGLTYIREYWRLSSRSWPPLETYLQLDRRSDRWYCSRWSRQDACHTASSAVADAACSMCVAAWSRASDLEIDGKRARTVQSGVRLLIVMSSSKPTNSIPIRAVSESLTTPRPGCTVVCVLIARQHAMHAQRDTLMANPSVCPSVCLSVALWYCI